MWCWKITAPARWSGLGCGYEQLARLNPRLVYLALKGYLAGPYEHRPALDKVVQFQTGLAFTGPIGQPLRAGASVIDIMGAMFGIIAAQAALRERDATGKGQRVSSALQNARGSSPLCRRCCQRFRRTKSSAAASVPTCPGH